MIVGWVLISFFSGATVTAWLYETQREKIEAAQYMIRGMLGEK